MPLGRRPGAVVVSGDEETRSLARRGGRVEQGLVEPAGHGEHDAVAAPTMRRPSKNRVHECRRHVCKIARAVPLSRLARWKHSH